MQAAADASRSIPFGENLFTEGRQLHSCLTLLEGIAKSPCVPYAEPHSARYHTRPSSLLAIKDLRREESCDERKKFRRSATSRWKSGDHVARFAGRRLRVSGCARRILQLA